MNDLVRQLLSMGPALGAGVSGNGDAIAAFMEGYQRTQQQLQQQRLQAQDRDLAMQDRDRLIGRQENADAQAKADRERQIAMQGLAVPGQLAEMGATADSPEAAKALIESMMPNVLKAFGQDAMAFGQPAVDLAQTAITGRQKKQVEAYVEAALKTSFVADNPEADPELTNLPEHIQRIVGKPSVRLSELQRYAALPVGKPAGKTRVPPAAGSMEEFSDPATTPERKAAILADRKAYMQSDDKPTVNVTLPGGISTKAGDAALKFQDDYARDSKPWITIRDAFQRVQSAAAKPDAAGDLSMIFAYMKMLDPNSVVREQEFANAQNAAGVPARVRNLYNRVMEGTRLAPEQRQQFLEQAEGIMAGARANQRGVRTTYGDRAKQWGIPETMVLDKEDPLLADPPPKGRQRPSAPPSSGPKVGDRRKFGDVLGEWNGKEWVEVKP